VPVVFQASARVQAGVGIAFMVLAAGATRWLRVGGPKATAVRMDFQPRRAVAWTGVFLALVWMDSAAFYIIQHTPALRAGTWGGGGSLWLNAAIHFMVAAVTGLGLDRGWLGRVAVGAWAALAGACWLLAGAGRSLAGAEVLYTTGVSLYSVALVYYPASSGRVWVAGGLFAVAGWLGSALGIGMAQDLHAVPPWFVGAAGAVVIGVVSARQLMRAGMRRSMLQAVGVVGIGSLTLPATPAEGAELAVRGREVFIGEGCMHCHSQYLRPQTADVLTWGPEKPLAESLAESPPLPGNRRQGPDLTQVGNRRSPEWNRLHLIEPRAVSPGSRMPSYAHLFRASDGRGEALVAYLESLGADTAAKRAEQVAQWRPQAGGSLTLPATTGAELFAKLCVNCHGADGRGDGILAQRLSGRPPDWPSGGWRRLAGADDEAVARVIKFGLPGTPMAGHEYLRDDELVSLARYVRTLHGVRKSP
jgi:cytochrome c oxidase cbb3-type subunit 2